MEELHGAFIPASLSGCPPALSSIASISTLSTARRMHGGRRTGVTFHRRARIGRVPVGCICCFNAARRYSAAPASWRLASIPVAPAATSSGGRPPGCPGLTDAPLVPWPDWLLRELAPKVQPPKPTNGHVPLRGDAWLRGLTRTVASAAEGQRNSTLFWAVCRARDRVAGGSADEGFIADVLLEAARHAGLPLLEAQRTIARGMQGRS